MKLNIKKLQEGGILKGQNGVLLTQKKPNTNFSIAPEKYSTNIKPKTPVKINSSPFGVSDINSKEAKFIYNRQNHIVENNPGLEIVSPEFALLTGGVGSLGTKAVTTLGKIGQTVLHGGMQGAMWNAANLTGSKQNLQGLATDVLGGAVIGGLLKGAGIGINKSIPLIKNTGNYILNKAKPLIISSNENVFKTTSGKPANFKSEIDWGKWNKEIPSNKPLMDEYLQIEQTAKQNGSWMKNPDGTAFKGTNPTEEDLLKHGINMTPEQAIKAQFIQQNSKNIPNNVLRNTDGSVQSNYHASKANDITEFKEEFFNTGAGRGLFGKGNYTTNDKNYAKKYLGFTIGNEITSRDKLYHLYINSKNPASGNVQKLLKDYGQKTKDIFKNIDEIPTRQQLAEKYNLTGNSNERIDKMLSFYGEVPRENLKIPFQENDYLEIYGMKSGQEQVTPFSNYLKSAIGNNGMFDMTNPNIYKGLVPAAGLYGLTQYKKGGTIYIKPENKGKFTATKKATGKSTEELTHSKNPLTRKRAIFAQNVKKWKHQDGGLLELINKKIINI